MQSIRDKMTSNFKTFWPILKVLQILGLFPIKKSEENLCGFEAMPTGKYLVLTVTVQSLGFACYVGSFVYVMPKQKLDFMDLLRTTFAVEGSSLDTITYFGVIILTGLSSFGVLVGVFPLKGKLIKLLELFHSVNLNATQEGSWKNKSMLLLIVIAFTFFPIFIAIGLFIRMTNHINMDVYTAILFGALHFATLFPLEVVPMCSFLFLFNEPCYNLNIWLENLIQKVELKIGSEQQLVYECKQFLYVGLKNTNDAFSGLLFWITSTVLINMILISLFHSALLTVFLVKP